MEVVPNPGLTLGAVGSNGQTSNFGTSLVVLRVSI